MKILLFGVSNVGKTTAGRILADKLEYDFYDLDEEVKKHYNMTLEEFVHIGTLYERDRARGFVIDKIMKSEGNMVFCITPISYPENFERHLEKEGVLAIELQDSPENIFERLVFSDENDNIYNDDEYKNARKDYYMSDLYDDAFWYGKCFNKVKNKLFMDNDSPETVAERIINEYGLG